MSLHLFVELGIIAQKRLYRFSDDVFLVYPNVCRRISSFELGSVVSQMVDANHVVAHGLVYLVDGISYHRASYVAYMERLGYVRR